MKRQRIRKAIILVLFLFFPVTIFYFSPALIIMGAAQGIVVGSFIVFALLFVSALFLGRAFCGWVCAAGGLQEACFIVRDKGAAGGKCNWIKYLIWIPWMSIIILFAIRAGGFHRIDPFFETQHGISIAEPSDYIIFYIVTGLIVILAFAAGKRGFCHYVCWIVPFMIIGRKIRNAFKWPSFRLLAEKENCIECKKCTKACPMSLDVQEMVLKERMENTECILCGTCIDICPKDIIHYTFSRGK